MIVQCLYYRREFRKAPPFLTEPVAVTSSITTPDTCHVHTACVHNLVLLRVHVGMFAYVVGMYAHLSRPQAVTTHRHLSGHNLQIFVGAIGAFEHDHKVLRSIDGFDRLYLAALQAHNVDRTCKCDSGMRRSRGLAWRGP